MSETASELGCPSGYAPAQPTADEVQPGPFVKQDEGGYRLELSVTGAKCAGCIAKIEGALTKLPDVTGARLNLSTGKLTVQWSGNLKSSAITKAVSDLGYTAIPFDPATIEEKGDAYGRFLLRCMAVAGFAAANIMLLSVSVWAAGQGEMGEATRSLLHLISALIAIPAIAFAGRPFFQSAWKALKSGAANMDVPISLAVVLAVGVSLYESLAGGAHAYFDAAIMLLFFLLIGRWLDHRLRARAHSAARDLLALQATTAVRLDHQGAAHAIAVKDIRPGDRLVVAPGGRLPVNAQVVEGQSDIDLAFLTGETAPQTVREGDRLYAGTSNLSKRLIVKATADAASSLVADLARLIEAGQQAKDQYTILADKAARAYVPIVHGLAAITFVGWLLFGGGGFREAVMAATAVLIITCPCALGLATPAVQVVATSQLFRRGILVKSGNALERLAKIEHIVFDKTGTLTFGQLEWTNPDDLGTEQREQLASLARAGLHPMARAIALASGPGPLAADVEEVPGEGLRGDVAGIAVRMGRAGFVGATQDGASPRSNGPSTWLRIGDSEPIFLRFQDKIRADGPETIAALRRAGLAVSLLSGDADGPVNAVADALHIDDHQANLSPNDKVSVLKNLKRDRSLAMVGDGINDAPALSLADVSFSPGTAADAAQSAADLVFQGDGIYAVYESWRMAIRARRHILQNFAFAALYNAIAAPLAMAGVVTPLFAALAMSGSSLVVTLNAMRLVSSSPSVRRS